MVESLIEYLLSEQIVESGDSKELIYWTYYMLDWKSIKQEASTKRCVKCGSKMSRILGFKNEKGRDYEGLACHSCKTVIWISSD